mgnify:CR=1 FL=1
MEILNIQKDSLIKFTREEEKRKIYCMTELED